MDPELKEASSSGDLGFIKKAIESKPKEYFLSQYTPTDDDEYVVGNILHLAAWNDDAEFFEETMKLLPAEVKQQLLSQPDKDGWNPLHVAAKPSPKSSNLRIVEVILGFYKSDQVSLSKPWLALTPKNKTALHIAMDDEDQNIEGNENCALEILSMDLEFLSARVDDVGDSALFLAVKNGFNRVAEMILMSSFSYSVSARHELGSTPLHFASKSSEKVLRLLLKKHQNLMDTVDKKGFNVLHQWAEIGETWPLNVLLDKEFDTARAKVYRDLIYKATATTRLDTPIHTAGRTKENTEFVKALVRGYQQEIKGDNNNDNPPWKINTKFGDTTLHTALYARNKDLALHLLSLDSTFYCHSYNSKGESPLLLAVGSAGCGDVVDEILRTQKTCCTMLRRNDGTTVLHWSRCLPEKIGRKVVEKFWWINNLPNDKGKTALDMAKESNVAWLVKLLMDPSLIQREPFDWINACEKGEIWAIHAFIDNCPDLQKVCRDQKDTPLHHLKLQTYKDYSNLLKNPSIAELKNTTDFDGATPLHRALERSDLYLAKALLSDEGVERDIEDYHGRAAMNLLAKLCKENDEWAKMCKQINVNPYLKITYIQPGTDLGEMRSTLSMVAALLATITFAAGFTLPGGLNSDTGNAILSKKAAFLIFLLSDVYVMCTSMLVLFCLIWSMVSSRDMSYLLVDRSVVILMQSLYATMVAFMTGIYVVIAHNSLWAAIIIFVMCSFIGISANRAVLHNVLAKLVPAANQDKRDRARSLEEGKDKLLSQGRAFASRNDNSRSSTSIVVDENNSLRNQDIEDQLPLLEEEKSMTSEKEDIKKGEERSSNPLQKSKSFMKEKKVNLVGNQDTKVQLPLLEEEKASTSGNDDS